VERWQARALYWPTLGYNYLLARIFRFRHWWDHIDQQVILGARPFRRDARRLQAAGVTGVVNMCEEYVGPMHEYARLGIEQLYLPTIDFNHPLEEHVDAGADFIERHVAAGGVVYVHCKAGRARSATIVLWWLVKYRYMAPEEAQRHLEQYRKHINPRVYLRPVIQTLYTRMLAERGAADPVAEAQAAMAQLPPAVGEQAQGNWDATACDDRADAEAAEADKLEHACEPSADAQVRDEAIASDSVARAAESEAEASAPESSLPGSSAADEVATEHKKGGAEQA
jgi:atypical dual specificity phosphatase